MPIKTYKLINKNGIELSLMNYGATITSLKIPKEKGSDEKINIVCGFNSPEEYKSKDFLDNAPYFGATIGRYCATISPGSFDLDGEHYELSKNTPDGATLHGGVNSFDKRIWDSESLPEKNAVRFCISSPDGDNGFPGDVRAEVIIALNEDNSISFTYAATTTKKTPFSMTSHAYYNLSGFKKTVEDMQVYINSHTMMSLDAQGDYRENLKDVKDSLEDFRKKRKVKDVQDAVGGLENYYVFDDNTSAHYEHLRHVATILDPESGRSMDVRTSEPGMLFYTGKYTSEKLRRDDEERYGKFMGFTCETHRYPNGPNLENVPENVYMTPECPFHSQTIINLKF